MTTSTLPTPSEIRLAKHIWVVGDPVPKARPRFGNGRTFTPRKTEKAEWQIRQTWVEQHGDLPTAAALRMHVIAWLTQPSSIPKSRRLTAVPAKRPDIDNLAKTVLDALNHVAYRDDGQIVELNVEKRYAVDAVPRMLIELTEVA